jgi:two-component system sensor histidine kinase ChiS
MDRIVNLIKLKIENFQLSLLRHFGVFTTIIFFTVIISSVLIGVSTYISQEKNRRFFFGEQADRIDRALSESFNYVTHYARYLGDKIIQQDSSDPQFISSLLRTKTMIDPNESRLYSWTMFDWIDANNNLSVSTQYGVLIQLHNMSHRKYTELAEKHPWKLLFSEPAIGIPSGQWILPTGIGIVNPKTKKYYGIIGTGFNIARLREKIEQVVDIETAFLVVDKEFNFIMKSPGSFEKPIKDLLGQEVKDFIQSSQAPDAGTLSTSIDYENLTFSYYRKSSNYPLYIFVGDNKAATHADLRDTMSPRIIEITLMGILAFILLLIARKSQRQSHAAVKVANESLEQKVTERTLALVSAMDAKKEFLRNMSHEIRISIHGIKANAEGLIWRWDEFADEPKRQLVTLISDSSERLLLLINNLLDMSKFEAGKMTFLMEERDLVDVVKQVLEECTIIAKPKKITLTLLPPKGFNTVLSFDKIRIEQVLRNLVGNAIKFTPTNGIITAFFEPTQIYYPDGTKVAGINFHLKDEGMGVPEEEKELIFHLFTQSTRTKTKAGGTGLGLSIACEIIKAHHGEIWCKNNVDGKGATFTFSLPMEQSFDSKEFDMSGQSIQ